MAGKKYWDVMYTLRPSTSLQMPNIKQHHPGIDPGPPLIEYGRSTIELWNLYIKWVCSSYITSQYFSPNAKYWIASSGNWTRAPPDRMWTLYHLAMESVHNMGVLVIHYVPVLLSKCQILNCIVRESNPGPPPDRMWTLLSYGICT
jgi:hypothetical protein